MSRNQHFQMGEPLGTSYHPSSEGSSEGDILRGLREDDANVAMGGLREDDADVQLRGLREDDANVSLRGLREDDAAVSLGSTEYEGATGSAEGSAEGGRLRQMGVSSYDRRQPSELVSNGKMGGMREDRYDVQLNGLREDDADVSLRGLREDDASISMDGLREDDADVSLGTADNPSASGSAEGDRLGDVDSMSAEAYEVGAPRGIRQIAHRAAQRAFVNARRGGIRSRAEANQLILQRVEAAAGGSTPATKRAFDAAMKHWGPKIDKALAKKVTVSGLRLGYILRGLREDDATIQLGRQRLVEVSGAEQNPPALLAAEGFHERFPVRVDIEGLGRIGGLASRSQIASIFEFLKRDPTAEEYMGKLRVVIESWHSTAQRLAKVNDASRKSIIDQMTALDNAPGTYDRLSTYLAEGYPGYSAARWSRIQRLEAYLPTVSVLIDQAIALGGGVLTPAAANTTAAKDLADRQASLGEPSFLENAAPVAAGVGGAGALTLLILAIGGVI